MDARRFDELLQRWQDGDAGAAELEELASLLRQDPLRRRELVTSMIDGRLRDRAQDPIRHVGRTRDLEKMTSALVGRHATGDPSPPIESAATRLTPLFHPGSMNRFAVLEVCSAHA